MRRSKKAEARLARFFVAVAIATPIAAAGLVMSGCSTVRGVGEDLTYAADETAKAISGEDAKGDR